MKGDVEKELGGGGDGGGGEERRKGFGCVKSLCGFETKQQPKVDRRGKGKRAENNQGTTTTKANE